MTWNNRIIKMTDKNGTFYGLHEVYYDAINDDGEPTVMWTEKPAFGYFNNVEELIGDLELMLKDANRCKDDILDLEELQKKYGRN